MTGIPLMDPMLWRDTVRQRATSLQEASPLAVTAVRVLVGQVDFPLPRPWVSVGEDDGIVLVVALARRRVEIRTSSVSYVVVADENADLVGEEDTLDRTKVLGWLRWVAGAVDATAPPH